MILTSAGPLVLVCNSGSIYVGPRFVRANKGAMAELKRLYLHVSHPVVLLSTHWHTMDETSSTHWQQSHQLTAGLAASTVVLLAGLWLMSRLSESNTVATVPGPSSASWIYGGSISLYRRKAHTVLIPLRP
jgi:hypothetical protein